MTGTSGVLGFTVVGFEVPLEVIVIGLITGLTYALLGVGVVLVYRTSRVLNFAHGEMGAVAAYLIPPLVINEGWGYWPALVVALAAGLATGAFMELVVVRHLSRASRLVLMVATIGASQLFFAIGALVPKEGLGAEVFPTPFEASITVGDVRLGTAQLLILAVVPVVAGGLALFFRKTKIGLASRAAAENDDAAQLAGIPVRRISLAVWLLVGLLATVSAILLAPTRPIADVELVGPTLMFRALAAALLGGLTSMPRVFAAGVAIGVVELLVSWNYPTGGVLEAVLLVALLGSLFFQRQLRQAARGGEASTWSLAGSMPALDPAVAGLPLVRRLRAGGLALAVVAAVLAPLPFSNASRVLMSSVVLFALMGLSLVVLTGFAGQVSLGQFAFVGLGALVGGRLHQLGYPPGTAVLYATLAGGAAALVVGLPALRIRGLFLAVTTLGFAIVAHQWLFQQAWLVKVIDGRTSLEIPRPELFGVDLQDERNYYWLCLAVLVVVAAGVHRLRSTGVGRAMMAVRDNEPAAATLGVSPRRAKLTAFVIAGMMASLAGYLYGGLLVSFTDPNTFLPQLSLALVALVILGGVTTITGAVVGAIWIRGGAHWVAPLLPDLLGSSVALLVGGVGLLAAILQFPGGVASALFGLRNWVLRRVVGRAATPAEVEAGERARVPLVARASPSPEPVALPVPALECREVAVCYGGNVALDSVSLAAAPGEIVGVVGPNGAGKTTLFDVLSGHLRPDGGQVLVHGEDVTALRPEQRARLGLGRTFQTARLFGEMPLREACKVALEAQDPSEVVPSLLGLPPSLRSERAKQLKADELLELMGLAPYAHFAVNELSTGMRRFAELASMVALGADVLLLDEPTSGIAQREVEAFRPVLREIRDHLGATMVIVEHDIPLIMGLVDRLYVLAAGQVIAEGPPDVLREDARVIAAYLGTDERVIARSGAVAAAVGGGS